MGTKSDVITWVYVIADEKSREPSEIDVWFRRDILSENLQDYTMYSQYQCYERGFHKNHSVNNYVL